MALIPATLQQYAARGRAWADWLDALPRVVRELAEEWGLALDGEGLHGRTALVVPVRADGRPAMLKVGWPHPEAEHEALALQRWGGRGAVRLLRADPHRWALLLERLGSEDLTDHWDLQACEIVGGLYGLLHVAAPPQLRRLSEQAARWAETLGSVRDLPVPRRMVEHARALTRDFAADAATDGVMIHTDLHYQNVLVRSRDGAGGASSTTGGGAGGASSTTGGGAGGASSTSGGGAGGASSTTGGGAGGASSTTDGSGDEYVAIDPKPLSGDPHYEVAPMLWNRYDEYAGRFREAVRMRFFALVDAAGLDETRARDWVIVRLVVTVVDELGHATPDRDWVTAMLSIAKAVQE